MPRKKTFKYELKDLISEYNEDLYKEVSDRIPMELLKNTQDGWTARIKEEKAIITYKKSDYADACFSHELLHIKYELNGLKQPMIKDNEGVIDIMPLLFNQLCHHKFYQEFYDLGFNEDEFLNDHDAAQIDQLAKRDIKLLEKIHSENGEIQGSTTLLLPYIMLKSPHDNSESTLNHITKIRNLSANNFFDTIDNILNDWRRQKSLDSSMTFALIFKACNRPKVGFCLSGVEEDIIVAGNL